MESRGGSRISEGRLMVIHGHGKGEGHLPLYIVCWCVLTLDFVPFSKQHLMAFWIIIIFS